MIETFVSKNQHFLHLYGRMARITGWMLLALGFPWLCLKTISVVTRIGDWKAMKAAWDNVPSGLFMFLIFGMVALGISDIIRYLTKENDPAGWVLGWGDKLLYFYAACVVLNALLAVLLDFPSASVPLIWRIVVAVVLVLATLGKVLVLIGLGLLWRRVMPVLEEARTLV